MRRVWRGLWCGKCVRVWCGVVVWWIVVVALLYVRWVPCVCRHDVCPMTHGRFDGTPGGVLNVHRERHETLPLTDTHSPHRPTEHCTIPRQQHTQPNPNTPNTHSTTENDSERDVYQVRIEEKVETIWLFDTGTDSHVMPKHVWEQLGDLHCKLQK